MKTILVLLALLPASYSFASEGLCRGKQTEVSIAAIAQQTGFSAANSDIVNVEEGIWSDDASENSGTDRVIVRISDTDSKKMIFKAYDVSAKQIGNSTDCDILNIVEIPR